MNNPTCLDVSDLTQIQKRQRFAEAMQQGLGLSLIRDELKIGRSTAFLWRDQWELEGGAWLAVKKRSRYVFNLTPNLRWKPGIVKAISLQYPDWGCDRIAEFLSDFGVSVSSPTVQKILIEFGLGEARERLSEIEMREILAEFCDGAPVSESQTAFLAKQRKKKPRPEFGVANAPGKLLVQDTCISGSKLNGAIYRGNVVVDTFDNRIFCYLSDNSWNASHAIRAIDEVIAIFRREKITVEKVMTDHGREFGADGLNYQTFLVGKNIKHEQFGIRRISPTRPKIIMDAWSTIVHQFIIPNHARVRSGDVSREDLDFELFEWLTQWNAQKSDLRKAATLNGHI